jgi:hypothetical protein
MAWVDPKTDWQPDQIVTAGDMNDIGGNLDALKQPPTDISTVDHDSDFSTNSTTFVDVDLDVNVTTNQFAVQVTTNGGPLLVTFTGSLGHNASTDTIVYFDLTLDGLRIGGDNGITMVSCRTGEARNVSFVYWIENISAATHTVKLQWRTVSGTATLWAGAGVSGVDVHPQFSVREVS